MTVWVSCRTPLDLARVFDLFGRVLCALQSSAGVWMLLLTTLLFCFLLFYSVTRLLNFKALTCLYCGLLAP